MALKKAGFEREREREIGELVMIEPAMATNMRVLIEKQEFNHRVRVGKGLK